MSGLSCALIVIFVLTITALAALYFYVTRHQRRFRRQSLRTGTSTTGDHESTSTETVYYVPSKELLYFFWWNNNQSRAEATPQMTVPGPRPDPSAPADIELDVLKLFAALQGHPRSLFTISEEGKKETESEVDNKKMSKTNSNQGRSNDGTDNHRTSLSSSEGDIIGRVSLSECFPPLAEDDSMASDAVLSDTEEVVVEKEEEEVEEEEVTTPVFTTPNASPPYLTPSDSPLRDSTYHVHYFTSNSRGRRGFRRSQFPRAEFGDRGGEDNNAVAPSASSGDSKHEPGSPRTGECGEGPLTEPP